MKPHWILYVLAVLGVVSFLYRMGLRRLNKKMKKILPIVLCLISSGAFGALNPPTNFRTDPADFSDVAGGASGWIAYQFRWQNNDPNQTGIQIEVSTNGSTYFIEKITTAAATGYDSSNIPWTSNRWYRIKAISGTDSSTYAGPIKGVGNMPPTNLGGSTADTTHMNVTWATAGGYLTGYTVQQDTSPAFSGGNLKEYGVAGQGSTSFNINFAFVLNTIYYFRVVSTNSNAGTGNSDAMNKPISYLACAPNGPPVSPSFVTQNMDANANESQLFFDDVALNTTGWLLRYSINAGATWTTNSPAFTGQTRYTFIQSALSGGSTYQYQLYATNSLGLSAATTWTFVPPLTPAGSPTVWYVDLNAVGNSTGTNWANAWESLGSINWSVLGPDHVVYISGGNYTNYIVTFGSGTYGHPITLKTATNAPHNGRVFIYGQIAWKSSYVTIDGAIDDSVVPLVAEAVPSNINMELMGRSTADSGLFPFVCVGANASWIEIHDFGNPTSGEGDGNGINAVPDTLGPTNSAFAYLWIHDCFGHIILQGVASAGYIASQGIVFHHILGEHCHNNFVMGQGAYDMHDCLLRDFKAPGVAHPDCIQGGFSDTRIWNNRFLNFAGQGFYGDFNGDQHDIMIVNNVFAALVQDSQIVPQIDGLIWSNCIISGNTFAGILVNDFTWVSNGKTSLHLKRTIFDDNILFSSIACCNNAAQFSTGGWHYSPADVNFNYNVLCGPSKLLAYRTNDTVNNEGVFVFTNAEEFTLWSTIYKTNTSLLVNLPNFSAGNYQPFGGDTVAVDTGTNLSSLSSLLLAITNDIVGIQRQGPAWDRGAYERNQHVKLNWSFEGFTNARNAYAQDWSGYNVLGVAVGSNTITSIGAGNYCPTNAVGIEGFTSANFQSLGTNEQWQRYHANLGYNIANWLIITNTAPIDFLTNGTIAFWVNYTNTDGPGDATIFSAGFASTDNSWDVTRYNHDNLYLGIYTNGTERLAITVPNPSTNQWQHVAFTWNASSNSVVGYTNGVAFQTNTMQAPYLHIYPDAGNVLIGGSAFGLDGFMQNGHPNNGWFNGYLDGVYILDQDLSGPQVYALYSGGVATSSAGGGGGPTPPPPNPQQIARVTNFHVGKVVIGP